MIKTPFSRAAKIEEAARNVTESYRARGFFPSAAVSIFTAEKTLCRFAMGDARVDTVFDVASLSKIATATQILCLIDAGQLRLSDRILSVLPSLAEDALLSDRLQRVTIASLLTHTSGIVDWYPFYAEEGSFDAVLRIALARYGPVEGMVYSDINFMLLGRVLEAAYGMSLAQCLQEKIAKPIGARMVYLPPADWDIAPSSYGNPIEEAMCAERDIRFGGWRPHTPLRGEANDGNAFYYFGGMAGSAGVFADVQAYERLGQFHLITDRPILVDAQREHEPTRGLGWQTGPMYPDGCGHTGFTGTSIYISRRRGIGVAAFTNRLFYPHQNQNATNEYRRALHEAVVDLL